MEKSKVRESFVAHGYLRAVLILLSPLNDFSAVQEVTGRIQRIVMRALLLGEKLEV